MWFWQLQGFYHRHDMFEWNLWGDFKRNGLVPRREERIPLICLTLPHCCASPRCLKKDCPVEWLGILSIITGQHFIYILQDIRVELDTDPFSNRIEWEQVSNVCHLNFHFYLIRAKGSGNHLPSLVARPVSFSHLDLFLIFHFTTILKFYLDRWITGQVWF